ncbi:hypothetical protein XarbCFBP6827_14625 [Xanthomonas arboricola]|nr:hypothetical protein XarbCFBP6827_14625 [Xanthomonas arboricola]
MRYRAADRLRTPIDLAHNIWRFHATASVYCRRLHAYRCGTRRKYVHVGSGAASMPLKVPRRHPRKHHRSLSATERKAAFGWQVVAWILFHRFHADASMS